VNKIMRTILVFLMAFGLSSLTVIGQDAPDGNAELKQRIDRLTAELDRRMKRREAADVGKRAVLQSYDISDLCSPVQDTMTRPTNVVPTGLELPELAEFEPRSTYEVDTIIELVRSIVAPASWDVVEGADIQPKGTRIFVSNLPRVHKLIPQLLEHLREYLSAQVAIEIVAVPVSAATATLFQERPRELTKEEAEGLLAVAPLGYARLVCFDGQQVVQKNGTLEGYIADYALKIAEGASIAQPVRARVFSGCAAEVRACLDRAGKGAVLHCRVELTDVEKPIRKIDTTHGPLDLPAMRLTRLHTSLWVPLDRAVVLGAGTHGAQTCAFVAKVRRVGPAR